MMREIVAIICGIAVFVVMVVGTLLFWNSTGDSSIESDVDEVIIEGVDDLQMQDEDSTGSRWTDDEWMDVYRREYGETG